MTKRELLNALADAPEDATVYIDPGNGILRSTIEAEVYLDEIDAKIVLAITEPEEDE